MPKDSWPLENCLAILEQAQGLDGLQAAILTLRADMGVDHVVYHWVSADGEQYGCGTYDPVWVQRYVNQDYLRIDPVVIAAFQRFQPVDWRRLDWSSRPARAFRADAMAHGVGNQGFSVPIRGPNGQFALFSLSHSTSDTDWADFTRDHQRDLILMAYYFNSKALELQTGRVPEPARHLSPREVDTLTFLAMGYARSQVAEMLDISEHTLRAYIEGARSKLGATNTIHAVVRAIADGLIVVGGAARGAAGDWPGRAEHPPDAGVARRAAQWNGGAGRA